MADGAWKWTADLPAVYEPGGGVERSFCLICGSPIAYRSPVFPGEMDFFAGTLDDIFVYAPTRQSFSEEAMPWLHLESLLR